MLEKYRKLGFQLSRDAYQSGNLLVEPSNFFRRFQPLLPNQQRALSGSAPQTACYGIDFTHE